MEARLEMGEVLLAARIGKVLRELFLRVVSSDVTLGEQVSKAPTGKLCKFIRLAEGQNSLRIEGDRKLGSQTRRDLGRWKPEALSDGLGNIKTNCHSSRLPYESFPP